MLNLDTLIKPRIKDGISFSIPAFVVACAEPPEVGPDGNSEEAPPFEPEPPPPPTCDAEMCGAADGHCEGDACVITCPAETCALSGGSCVDGECVVPPACDATACTAAGGTCEGEVCVVPTCDAAMCARGARQLQLGRQPVRRAVVLRLRGRLHRGRGPLLGRRRHLPPARV